MLSGEEYTEASRVDPSLLAVPVSKEQTVFEEDSEVERLVDEVLFHEADACREHDDGHEMGHEGKCSSCDDQKDFFDPYELLIAVGVKAFLEEQRSLAVDPPEIYEAFELEAPAGVQDAYAVWQHLEAALEEVYDELLCSPDEGDMMEMDTCDDEHVVDDDMSVELQEKLERANAFLVELRAKGPLEFADEHDRAGTSAAAFLSDLGFRLPKSMAFLDHRDQWGFIKRFLIKYVYQRPRNECLVTFNHAVDLIRKARKILVVTGAGISVSCGIPDFRSEDGLYRIIRERFALPEPECMFDIEYFRDDPAPFYMLAKVLEAVLLSLMLIAFLGNVPWTVQTFPVALLYPGTREQWTAAPEFHSEH